MPGLFYCGTIVLMIIVFLAVTGLCLGSFVNALVFRLHAQSKTSQKSVKSKVRKVSGKDVELSIVKGRSVCVHCGHELSWRDLVPVLSWLSLKGKCRYCHKPISWQYPAVELATAALFVVSYLFWPGQWVSDMQSAVNFTVWLVMLTGFVALVVYDLRWMLLPNRITYPLIALAAITALYNVAVAADSARVFADTLFSVLIAGGLFWSLFMASKGKWIGGGDVKLGLLAGLLLADPYKAFLLLLFASFAGCLVAVPGLITGRLKTGSRIPFGPFLIFATIIVMLFGSSIIDWYKELLLV